MQRRNFIKNTLCIGCLGTAVSICKNIIDYDNLKKDVFYYKTKDELPKIIRLEACSLCQLNCPVCAMRILDKDAPKDYFGYVKFKDFKKLVDDNNFEEIGLASRGEIFLNPELDEIIKYANLRGIRLTADTGVNFNDVSETTLENLVKYQFRSLTIAIDGATPEVYKIYRRGGDLNKVFHNIERINYYKKKYDSKFPKLTYQFILFGHNEHEIDLAKKKAKELKMKIKFVRNWTPWYSPIRDVKTVEKKTGLNLSKNVHISYYPCKKWFELPQIDYNGNLLGCRFIVFEDMGINVFKDGFLKALNSKKMIYARHRVTNFSIMPKRGTPCTNCLDYQFMKDNDYSIS